MRTSTLYRAVATVKRSYTDKGNWIPPRNRKESITSFIVASNSESEAVSKAETRCAAEGWESKSINIKFFK